MPRERTGSPICITGQYAKTWRLIFDHSRIPWPGVALKGPTCVVNPRYLSREDTSVKPRPSEINLHLSWGTLLANQTLVFSKLVFCLEVFYMASATSQHHGLINIRVADNKGIISRQKMRNRGSNMKYLMDFNALINCYRIKIANSPLHWTGPGDDLPQPPCSLDTIPVSYTHLTLPTKRIV